MKSKAVTKAPSSRPAAGRKRPAKKAVAKPARTKATRPSHVYAFYERINDPGLYDAVEDPEGGPESVDYATTAPSQREAERRFRHYLFDPEPQSTDEKAIALAHAWCDRNNVRVLWHATLADFMAVTDLPRFEAARKRALAAR